MSPATIRIVSWMIALGIVLGLLFIGFKSWREGQEAKEALREAQRTDRATSGIVTDIDSSAEEAHQVQVIVTDARSAYQRGYEDAKRDDPVIADLAAQPIPQRLRDLARQRREARERSGRVGDGGGGDAPTSRPGG